MKLPKMVKYFVMVAYVSLAFSLLEWLKKNGSIPNRKAVANKVIKTPNL